MEEGQTVVYTRADGQEVIGALRRLPRLRWATVAEIPLSQASSRVGRLRSATGLLIAALLAVDGVQAGEGNRIARGRDKAGLAGVRIAAVFLSVFLVSAFIGDTPGGAQLSAGPWLVATPASPFTEAIRRLFGYRGL